MANRFNRNLRLGEFNLLFLGAFLVAVALSTAGTFSERMEQTMTPCSRPTWTASKSCTRK